MLCVFGIYILHTQVTTFSEKIHGSQVKVAELEETKKVLDLYKKILVQGSKEQQDIEKYILTSKHTFDAVSQIEKDAKEVGLIAKDKGGIISVTSRENATYAKYDAHELVVVLHVEQNSDVVDAYIDALSNLPYVSYVEKVSLVINNKTKTTAADITVVLIESK